jgi:hypothetical protein
VKAERDWDWAWDWALFGVFLIAVCLVLLALVNVVTTAQKEISGWRSERETARRACDDLPECRAWLLRCVERRSERDCSRDVPALWPP